MARFAPTAVQCVRVVGGDPPAAPPWPGTASSAHPCDVDGVSARYSVAQLQRTLQLAGVRVRHARKVSCHVFDRLAFACAASPSGDASAALVNADAGRAGEDARVTPNGEVWLSRASFRGLVAHALRLHEYATSDVLEAFEVACAVHERRAAIVVLLCGTSGTGKSTLASLLASALGISSVISTDSVRHVLRSMRAHVREDNPVLWASTYDASEHAGLGDAVRGYEQQSRQVTAALDSLVQSCLARNESVIVEGVHLSVPYARSLMERHPAVIPHVIHISNREKHRDRFAVRAKYLTLDPKTNRYTKNFDAIQRIQDHLVRSAAQCSLPTIDNTSVDRSVAAIHATNLGYLRRLKALSAGGGSGAAAVWGNAEALSGLLMEEHRSALRASAWSSKGMLEVLRAKRADSPWRPDPAAEAWSSPSTTPMSTPRRGVDAEVDDDDDGHPHSDFGDAHGASSDEEDGDHPRNSGDGAPSEGYCEDRAQSRTATAEAPSLDVDYADWHHAE